MAALLYFATAILILWAVDRCVLRISRVAIVALLLLPLLFTGRALLTNRIYAPVEFPYISEPLWDHRAELHVGDPHNPVLSDIAFQMIPWREAVRQSLALREWPLLNRFEACGDILASAAQPAAFSPFTWIAALLPGALSSTYTASIAFFVAALGMFVLSRSFDHNEQTALVAAAIFTFSFPIAVAILWPAGFAWTLLPAVIAGVIRTIRTPTIGSSAFLCVTLVLEILAGHPETLLHVVSVALLFGAWEIVILRNGNAKRAVASIAASGVVALFLTAIALLPFLDAVSQTSENAWRRVYAVRPFHTDFKRDAATMAIDVFPFLERPLFMHRATAGSVALALALVAAATVRKKRTRFLIIVGAVAFLAGADAWPVAPLLHRIPLFSFAINSRLGAVVPLCLGLLVADMLDGAERKWWTVAVAMLFGVICIAVALSRAQSVDWQRFGVEVAPLFALAGVALLRHEPLRVSLVMVLILLQRTAADGNLIPVHPRSVAYPRLRLLDAVNHSEEPFRIVGLGTRLLANTATMYGLEDVRVTTAMTLMPFDEAGPLWLTGSPGSFPEVRDLTKPFLSLMNVRYALVGAGDPIPNGWHEVTREMSTALIENDHWMQRAFVPRRIRLGVPRERELDEMRSASDFADLAWIEGLGGQSPVEIPNGPGTLQCFRRGLGLDLDVTMEKSGYVVISQAAWRGWRAFVDAKPVPLARADHTFVAVPVPLGHHSVRLRFLPRSFVIGRAITAATALFLLALFCVRLPSFRARVSTPRRSP